MADSNFDAQTYFVRSSTGAGELIAETEAVEPLAGWELFDDTLHNSEETIVVELVNQDGEVIASNRLPV